MLYYNNEIYYGGKVMEKKLLKRSLSFAMMIAVVFSTIIASSFIKANAAETEKAVTLTQGENTSQHDTVQEAVAAVAADNTQAVITLNKDFEGAGAVVKKDQNIVFNLNGFTWNINSLVGSSGTETNGVQLLQGSTVTIENGTLTSKTAKLLIQNYCDLTIRNATLSGQDNLTEIIVSNNNGSTVITGNSAVQAAAGGIAFDSDKWGGYQGGNVTLENGQVIGNVNATNGGKISLNGGTVTGDVIASNYTYQGNEKTPANIVIDGATINGNVTAQNIGNISISSGTVTGLVSSESTSPVAVTGGVFHTTLGENVDTSAAEYVASIESNGQIKTVVGKTDFDAAVQSLKSGETINIQVVPENSTLTIPEGVTVTNKTNNNIVVNGNALNSGENITIQPEQPEPTPTPDPEPTPEPTPNPEDNNNMTESNNNGQNGSLTSPQTGNNSSSILYISLAFASAALLTIVSFTIRKMSKSK